MVKLFDNYFVVSSKRHNTVKCQIMYSNELRVFKKSPVPAHFLIMAKVTTKMNQRTFTSWLAIVIKVCRPSKN
jgi:hypothetical protein